MGRLGRLLATMSPPLVSLSQRLIQRRLTDVHRRLRKARDELAVIDEQLAVFAEAADDSRLRSLVSETPLAEAEHRETQRHADAMARSRVAVLESIASLERAQDELLGRLDVT